MDHTVTRDRATSIVIPEPTAALDYPVASVCADIVMWAKTVDDIAAIKQAKVKLEAIDLYLERTSVTGRAEVAATMRRLEVRIGVLLGDAQIGGDRRSDQVHRDVPDLSRQERHDFRRMAAQPDLVEEIIARSTDAKPASRRQVLGEIEARTFKEDLAEQATWAKSLLPENHDPTEGRRRQEIQGAIGEISRVIRELLEIATPDEVRWALKGDDHVAEHYRAGFVLACASLAEYRGAIN